MTHKYDGFCQSAIIAVQRRRNDYRICKSTVVRVYGAQWNDIHIRIRALLWKRKRSTSCNVIRRSYGHVVSLSYRYRILERRGMQLL